MFQADIGDNEIKFDDKVIRFPASYEDLRAVFGEARVVEKKNGTSGYVFDDTGITFEEADVRYLKKRKAFTDREHMISYVSFYIDDHELFDEKCLPEKRFDGRITFFGKEWESLKRTDGSSKHFHITNFDTCEMQFSHITSIIGGDDGLPNYAGGAFKKTLYCTFAPERPKTTENYNIPEPQEECMTFKDLNFKLAVIQELMYVQEILKPYFDIIDYLKFKKSKANVETEKNIRAAVEFFKVLPVPKSLAKYVTKITMDGGNEIYSNIAPLWDGEDGRFDVDHISADELSQFPELKEVVLMTSNDDELRSQLEAAGIRYKYL